MDLQTYLTNSVNAMRQESLKNSPQLTLGELILKLEPILEKQKSVIEKHECEANVVYDFEYLVPTNLGSWRGSYSELALGWTYTGYAPTDCPYHNNSNNMPISKFVDMLKNAIGKTYTGWKGGDFTMSKHTPVWVANPGNSGNTGIVDVVDNQYEVILITGYCKY